jgi:methionyl-tRNA synthetase
MTASQKLFISTPIYYPNDIPHIGHAYSSFIADTIARHARMNHQSVKFTTGVDENSQKIVQKAAELGRDVYEFLDEMAGNHKRTWDTLAVEYTDFVRTTAPHHVQYVQEVLQKSFDAGDIYEGVYEGAYCVGCEAFKKPSDLVNGECPLHPKGKVEHLKEKNWFFRLSKYAPRLLELYESHPNFVVPAHRFAEVKAFVAEGLEDFSISRESNSFGIPLPFDPGQVTYVWFDALYNYVSACQGEDAAFWSDSSTKLHVVGKDIIRFHAIYWPAMLMSANLPLPDTILTTGFFTVDGQKMSKSIGNVVNPVQVTEQYGRDFLVNYLLGSFPIGNDGDFSLKEATLMFNNRLANNIGNLLNRFIVLSLRLDGKIGSAEKSVGPAALFRDMDIAGVYQRSMEACDLRAALDGVFAYGDVLNKYIDEQKPWELKESADLPKLESVLAQVGEGIRLMAILLSPFFPQKMQELLARIGANEEGELIQKWEMIPALERTSSFFVKEKGEPLYMRISA